MSFYGFNLKDWLVQHMNLFPAQNILTVPTVHPQIKPTPNNALYNLMTDNVLFLGFPQKEHDETQEGKHIHKTKHWKDSDDVVKTLKTKGHSHSKKSDFTPSMNSFVKLTTMPKAAPHYHTMAPYPHHKQHATIAPQHHR
jgi:hypothetical protein